MNEIEAKRKMAELGTYAQDLAKLKEHESWGVLRQRFEKMKEDDVRSLSHQLLSGREVDNTNLAFRRGFWKGAQWVLDNPDLAQQAFEKAIGRIE